MTKTLTRPDTNEALEGFLSDYEAGVQTGLLGGDAGLKDLREKAITSLRETGLPTTSQEEWRFTSVAPLARTRLTPADRDAAVDLSEFGGLADLAPIRFVFVNGAFRSELSATDGLPAGLKAGSLRQFLQDEPELVKKHLATVTRYDLTPFTALNTAFMDDGFFLYVSPGVVVETPIQVLFLASSPEGATVSHPRNLIIGDVNSQVTLIESYAGREGEVYFTNAVTEFVVAGDAVVDHYRLQEESRSAFHFAALDAVEARASNFSTQAFTFGGGLVRNDIGIVMGGEGGFATMNGLYMIEGTQLVDNHTRLDHAEPHCETHEFYKGILDDKARGVFNGRILVRQKAQKTNSKQTNRNLLLSKEALINTNPQLEIFADDVKCTHGATIGQLEELSLYYLRTRGIPEREARRLLTFAFANDLIQRVRPEPLRARLEKRVTEAQDSAEVRHAGEASS